MGSIPDELHVTEVTATEAARNFASLLDGVEHRREAYTIVRRGRTIARVHPVDPVSGSDLKALLRRRRPDPAWSADLAATRSAGAMTATEARS